jgi:hypothetical protein
MSRNTALLELLARMNPAMWDAIHPMGPVLAGRVAFELAEGRAADELNPQPLPPRLAARTELVRASVRLAYQLTQLAVFSHAQSGNGAEILAREVDDWCGNSPRPFPWPKNWPIPVPGPDPEPWPIREMLVAAALTLAGLASRLGDGDLRGGFDHAIDRLTEAAIAG